MTPTEALAVALKANDLGPDYRGGHKGLAAVILAALPPGWTLVGSDKPGLSEHPGEFHMFSVTCDRCGKRGYLHLSVLGPDERFSTGPLLEWPTYGHTLTLKECADAAQEALEHG